jgi:hypothetical protein
MDVIAGSRRSGKTTKLLQMMHADENLVMLVHDNNTLKNIMDMSGFEKDRFITVGQVWTLRGTKKQLVIDNLDLVLWQLLAHPVRAVSVTPTNLGDGSRWDFTSTQMK